MTRTTITSREFNQDTARAKRAALNGPVFITDRGQPAHVLLSIRQYRALTATGANVVDLLAMPAVADIAFEPTKADKLFGPVDLG